MHHRLLLATSLLLLRTATAVLHGSYVSATDFTTANPFRGAVQSGGGTGIILFVDGDEAVVLTVAHGYDLTSMHATVRMDQKLNQDGGLRVASGSAHGYATSVGGQQIIDANLGLFRHFTFWDRESCAFMNNGVDQKHTGEFDDPFACDGLGPDIDVAIQRFRLNAAAQAMSFPEIGLNLEPLRAGMGVTLVGFGRKYPCDVWMDTYQQAWANGEMNDAIKTAENLVSAVFHSEAFTMGTSTVPENLGGPTAFGCAVGETVSDCGKRNGSLIGDADFDAGPGHAGARARWGTGCGGDSGGAWLTQAMDGSWSTVGVNCGPGKVKDSGGNWDQSDDTTYTSGICAGAGDSCQSTGTAIATLYPVRARIKAALTAWNPAWASKASYTCEPPTLDSPCCGSGCHMCGDGDGSFDCYPDSFNCLDVDALGSGKQYVCGENLGTTGTPLQQCVGTDPNHATPCRALTQDEGWGQTQVCQAAGSNGECPGLTTCCADSGCSTATTLPTCNSPPPTPPSPSTPPTPSPPVVLTMTASGSVSDYADTTALVSSIATLAGVDASLVTITVAAGSVVITVTIATPTTTSASAVQSALTSALSTASAASTALGITVEDVPTVVVAAPPPLLPPPGAPSGSGGGLGIFVLIGAIAVGVVVLAAVVAIFCTMKKAADDPEE